MQGFRTRYWKLWHQVSSDDKKLQKQLLAREGEIMQRRTVRLEAASAASAAGGRQGRMYAVWLRQTAKAIGKLEAAFRKDLKWKAAGAKQTEGLLNNIERTPVPVKKADHQSGVAQDRLASSSRGALGNCQPESSTAEARLPQTRRQRLRLPAEAQETQAHRVSRASGEPKIRRRVLGPPLVNFWHVPLAKNDDRLMASKAGRDAWTLVNQFSEGDGRAMKASTTGWMPNGRQRREMIEDVRVLFGSGVSGIGLRGSVQDRPRNAGVREGSDWPSDCEEGQVMAADGHDSSGNETATRPGDAEAEAARREHPSPMTSQRREKDTTQDAGDTFGDR